MSKNRYEELDSYLHFNDSSQEAARRDANYERLYKVRPIFDHISVDESMIAFQGRLSFRQYMPAKPTKYGIKVWTAADSSNACLEFCCVFKQRRYSAQDLWPRL